VDAAVAAAAPYLRGAAGHQIADANDDNAHTPRNGQGESCDEAEVHPRRRHHVRIRLPAGAVLRADLQAIGLRDIDRPDEVKAAQIDTTRTVRVELDANVNKLPLKFRSVTPIVNIHPGELMNVVYEVENTLQRP